MNCPAKLTSGMVKESSQEREETYGTSSYLFKIASPLDLVAVLVLISRSNFHASERLDHAFLVLRNWCSPFGPLLRHQWFRSGFTLR